MANPIKTTDKAITALKNNNFNILPAGISAAADNI